MLSAGSLRISAQCSAAAGGSPQGDVLVLRQILKEAVSSVEGDPGVAGRLGARTPRIEPIFFHSHCFFRVALETSHYSWLFHSLRARVTWQTISRTCDPGPCPSASNPRPWHPRLVRPCDPGYAPAFVTLAFGLATLCDPRPCDHRPCDPRSCDHRPFDPWPLTLGPATLDLVNLRPETLDLVSLGLVTLGFTRLGLVNLGLVASAL